MDGQVHLLLYCVAAQLDGTKTMALRQKHREQNHFVRQPGRKLHLLWRQSMNGIDVLWAGDFCEMPSREYVAAHMDQSGRRTASQVSPLHAERPMHPLRSRSVKVVAVACDITAAHRWDERMRCPYGMTAAKEQERSIDSGHAGLGEARDSQDGNLFGTVCPAMQALVAGQCPGDCL
jgi:hypothetical protein